MPWTSAPVISCSKKLVKLRPAVVHSKRISARARHVYARKKNERNRPYIKITRRYFILVGKFIGANTRADIFSPAQNTLQSSIELNIREQATRYGSLKMLSTWTGVHFAPDNEMIVIDRILCRAADAHGPA